jgi:hypothetical protein
MLRTGELMRTAVCPQCGAPSKLDAGNPSRPFCSERCKLLDLGAWFDGRHAIPAAPTDEDGNPDTELNE